MGLEHLKKLGATDNEIRRVEEHGAAVVDRAVNGPSMLDIMTGALAPPTGEYCIGCGHPTFRLGTCRRCGYTESVYEHLRTLLGPIPCNAGDWAWHHKQWSEGKTWGSKGRENAQHARKPPAKRSRKSGKRTRRRK